MHLFHQKVTKDLIKSVLKKIQDLVKFSIILQTLNLSNLLQIPNKPAKSPPKTK